MSQSPARSNANALLVPLGTQLPNDFADFIGSGPAARPADTLFNALIAIKKLGLECSHNVFRNEYRIGGTMLTITEIGEVSDNAVIALRQLVRQNFFFEPSARNMQDAVMRSCTMRSFHPIKDYFATLPRWDGIDRASRLLPDYFNTPDTPLNRAISRIVTMASVRRIKVPGTKFDYMTVLQSPEGFNKSSAIEALYGEENFTDQTVIGLHAKDVEEALRGMWAQENPELQGVNKADWNKLKAMLSRRNDRIRRVFDRNPLNNPRTVIQWGTSNDDAYLRALSGENRRFFSVDVLSHIDVAKIIRDRDEIWSEAIELETTGESVALPEEFWIDARAERDKRTEIDPWEEILRDVSTIGAQDARTYAKRGDALPFAIKDDEERIASSYLLSAIISIPSKDQQPHHGKRVGEAMRKLGWSGPKPIRIGQNAGHVKGYTRPAQWLLDLL